MRILGIDPGLQRTGFGIIEQNGSKLHYVTAGVIRTDTESSLAERIQTIVHGIAQVAQENQPDCAAVEIVFVNVNPKSTLLLGQARGAALAALVLAQLPVHEYTALQVKQATAGHGKAKKEQVQEMVVRLLNLSGTPTADAADALACAICHAHAGNTLSQLSALAPGLAKRGYRMKGGRLIG
jgi:crossover junction endodeoxyribonuclease RuvC